MLIPTIEDFNRLENKVDLLIKKVNPIENKHILNKRQLMEKLGIEKPGSWYRVRHKLLEMGMVQRGHLYYCTDRILNDYTNSKK